jgi:hypothetical protein
MGWQIDDDGTDGDSGWNDGWGGDNGTDDGDM